MIAVKRGAPDLTNTLLRGGCDTDVQENVSLLLTPSLFVHTAVCLSGRIYACSSHFHFEALLGKIGNENN